MHIVREFQGEVQELEGQALRWIDIENLHTLDFLQGNQIILDKLLEVEKR